MAKYINKYTNIEAYNADDGKQYPNVSYLVATDELKYSNPVVFATFDVTSPTKINVTYNPAAFAKIELNGQEIELVDTNYYDFGVKGKYTLKYTLVNETEISDKSWGWCYELIDMSNIPKTVTTIGSSAFLGCKFTDFIIPNSVKTIGDSAFNNCGKLTSITIPNSVTEIGDGAFMVCRGLKSVTIPNSITKIKSQTFEQCYSLTSFTIQATTPPTLGGTSAFNNTNNNFIIYVPAESVDAYKAATNWSELADRIQPIPTE